MGHTHGGGFALIVVLFILLIIVGALGYKSLYDEGGLFSHLLVVSLYTKGGYFMSGSHGDFGGGFALLVVLFILLIIIGASCFC